jgi:hypothetical protein
MANENTMSFIHPKSGNVVSYAWHPAVAGQMRLFYENKGFVFVNPNAPQAPVEPAQEAEEATRRKPGRPGKE